VGFSKQLCPYTAGTEASGKTKSIQESVFISLPDPAMVPAPSQRMANLQTQAMPYTNSSARETAARNTEDLRAARQT